MYYGYVPIMLVIPGLERVPNFRDLLDLGAVDETNFAGTYASPGTNGRPLGDAGLNAGSRTGWDALFSRNGAAGSRRARVWKFGDGNELRLIGRAKRKTRRRAIRTSPRIPSRVPECPVQNHEEIFTAPRRPSPSSRTRPSPRAPTV